MRRDKTREIMDAEARRIHGNRRYLIRKPRALQYFRGKVLVRSDDERASGRLELFFDLTFVGLIAVLAKQVAEHPTGAALTRYLITYSGAFLIWTWMREMFNSFYKDDMLQRFIVLFVMACLVVFGNNAYRVDQNVSEGPGRATAVTAYLLAELAIFGSFFLYSFHVRAYRLQLRVHTLAWLVAACVWISTMFVSYDTAVILSIVALIIEYGAWNFVYSPTFKRLLRLRYGSALNIEHELERFHDFFTLVMGEFLFSVFNGSPAGIGLHASSGRAVMAVVIAFSFQMFYMLGSSSKKITHPIRRSGPHAIVFFVIHVPLVSALTLCGDIMAEFVKDEHVEDPLRWFACETYAVGMVCLWVLGMIEKDRDDVGELWMPQWARLLPRLIFGLVAVFLPFTYQMGETRSDFSLLDLDVDMTTTKLLGVLTAMSSFALIWEQVASLDGPNAPFDCAPEHLMACATSSHPTRAALQTPPWKGYPTFIEPGAGTIDRSHQTYNSDNTLTPQVSRDEP